jgi:acetyltransferase-like isoleucine patch superfamily enzyme
MVVLIFFKRILLDVLYYMSNNYHLAKLQSQYPNCEFYPKTSISNTVFSNYNIVFGSVLMDSCTIGNHTYIQKGSNVFNADIGKFCSIASGVSIGPGIHKTDGVSTHPIFYLQNTPLIKKFCDSDTFMASKRTSIGHDVWIGQSAIVLDGVSIGIGAIIAAGSVVTKDVAPYAIVGGIPAKLIKYRFEQVIITKLIESKWWNFKEEWFEQHYEQMFDIERIKVWLNEKNIID